LARIFLVVGAARGAGAMLGLRRFFLTGCDWFVLMLGLQDEIRKAGMFVEGAAR
jgi:hypothetical protein